MTEVNARIKSVSLFIEDHGCLTAFLNLEFGASSQGFGGYNLGAKGENFCAAFIRGILDTLKIDAWERLPGTVIRVRHDNGPSMSRTIQSIGHAINDDWFNASDAMMALEKKVDRK